MVGLRTCVGWLVVLPMLLTGCEKPCRDQGELRRQATQQSVATLGEQGGLGRLTVAEAREAIQARCATKDWPEGWSVEWTCRDVTTDEFWNRLHAQVFKIGNMGPGFLIRGDEVLELGESFGGYGLTSYCVTDLDNDEAPEFVFSFSWGSGSHRSCVGIYCPDCLEPRIRIASFFYAAEDDLILEKVDDRCVALRILARCSAGVTANGPAIALAVDPEEPVDFSKLRLFGHVALQQMESGPELVIKPERDLPDDVQSGLWNGG